MLIADMRHYLDEHGDLAPMPAPAASLALFLGAIVAWTSGLPGADGERTNLTCRRLRSRPRCPGEISSRLAPDGERIEWCCRACGDGGTIAGWRETRWDRS